MEYQKRAIQSDKYGNIEQQSTPSWKVNLTQKLNSFSNKKHKQLNNLTNFDQQLQQRLNFIPTKQTVCSNKKAKLFENSRVNMPETVNMPQVNETKLNKGQKKGSIFDLSSVQNSSPKKLNFNSDQSQGKNTFRQQKTKLFQSKNRIKQSKSIFQRQQSNKHYKKSKYYSLLTDQTLAQYFQQYFEERQQIQISQFIEMCCIEYLKEQNVSQQLKKLFVQQCRSVFCTTQQNLISINIIELMTKKNSLKLILKQKLLEVKYNKKKVSLQKQYEGILQQIIQQQEVIRNQNQKIEQRKKQLNGQQKQLVKKQKILKGKQKDLVQKQKSIKKILEEKAHKLTTQLSQLFDKQYKQMDKKANSFQRNAKNKMQLIEKRMNDCKQMIRNIPQKDSQENIVRKTNNQILILRNKLKRLQKEYEMYKIQSQKQIKSLQTQSTNLLKANTILENKLQKSKLKLHQNIQKKDQTIQSLEGLINELKLEIQTLKNQNQEYCSRIQQLKSQFNAQNGILYKMNKSNNLVHGNYQKGQLSRQKVTQANNQSSSVTLPKLKSVHDKKSKKIPQYNNNQDQLNNLVVRDMSKTNGDIRQLLQIYNRIFEQIISGFKNHQNSLIKRHNQNCVNNSSEQKGSRSNMVGQKNIKQSGKIVKFQQVLLNQSSFIFILSSKLVWKAVQTQFYRINSILQFMIALFLAKLSFIKFQSLQDQTYSQNLISNDRTAMGKQVQSFIQKMEIQCLKDMQIQSLFRYIAIYIQELQSQQIQIQNKQALIINFYVVLLILGMDEIYNTKKKKSIHVLSIIRKMLINDIELTGNVQTKTKPTPYHSQILSKFQQQQFMTFLFSKYLSYSSREIQVYQFVQILLELCNYYPLNNNDSHPLFQTIEALENYKYLMNYLLINFNEQTLQKDDKLRQVFEKISIILQRFCYYNDKIKVDTSDVQKLKKLYKKLQKNQKTQNSLFAANIRSILQKITEQSD